MSEAIFVEGLTVPEKAPRSNVYGRSRRLHYCGMGWQTQRDGKDRDLCAWQEREGYHCD